MGRHSATRAVPRGRVGSPVIALSMLLVVVLVGWFAFDVLRDRLRAQECASSTVVTVVAAPDIAPAVAQLGRDVSEEDSADDAESCYQVRVTARESAAEAESLAISDGTERPDVWIPESTLWLQRAQDASAWNVPVNGTSVAGSPVVLAVTEAAAFGLGWPDRPLSWGQFIGPAARSLPVGIADPARDPVGVAALLGLQELVEDAPNPGVARTTSMRKLSARAVAEPAELFAKLPGGVGPADGNGSLAGFPTSEQAVLRHNAKQAGTPLVAVYPDAAVPTLDYPYVVLPKTPDAERAAAEEFLGRLLELDSSRVFADAGFRTPEGEVLRDRSRDHRTSAGRVSSLPLPSGLGVAQVLNAWAAVNLSGRLQVLLDVSGSMDEQVPGTGRTRMSVTIQAATRGLGLFKPTTKLGLWLFATRLNGNKDYRVLLPMRPLREQLAGGALNTLRSVRALPSGNTALYDAVLAAYQEGRRNWEAGRINAVVVLTDGKDDNASDVTRARLLGELRKLRDPRRPLKLIGIGIGPDVDAAELKAISEATDGRAFIAKDPTRIGEVFYSALSLMLCQPPACQPGSAPG